MVHYLMGVCFHLHGAPYIFGPVVFRSPPAVHASGLYVVVVAVDGVFKERKF